MSKVNEIMMTEGSATSQGFTTLSSPVMALESCAVIHHAVTFSKRQTEVERDLSEKRGDRKQDRR